MDNNFAAPTHESINFKLNARERSCFYDDINLDVPGRTIEVFAHSDNTDVAVLLSIHGPLKYEDILHVIISFIFFAIQLKLNPIFICRKHLKILFNLIIFWPRMKRIQKVNPIMLISLLKMLEHMLFVLIIVMLNFFHK